MHPRLSILATSGLTSMALACAAELGDLDAAGEGTATSAISFAYDAAGGPIVVANDVGRYWIATHCGPDETGNEVGPGYVYRAAARTASGERVRTQSLGGSGQSEPVNGGWAKFGLHLYRPALTSETGMYRLVEGGVCLGAHPGWPFFGAGVSRGWVEAAPRRTSSGEIAFAVGTELSDGVAPVPIARVLYRYRVGPRYVRVWTTVTELCGGTGACRDAYVKEPKFTVSDGGNEDPYLAGAVFEGAGTCAQTSGRLDPRCHTLQCIGAERDWAEMSWGSAAGCAGGCLRVLGRGATAGGPGPRDALSTTTPFATASLADCSAAHGIDRWACLSTQDARNPRFPSPSASCSRGINALRRWELVRWEGPACRDLAPLGPTPQTQLGYHAWEGGWGLDDCVNLYRRFGPAGETFHNFFSFRIEVTGAAPIGDDEPPPSEPPPSEPPPSEPPPPDACSGARTPVARCYRASPSEHLYTTDPALCDAGGYAVENRTFFAVATDPAAGMIPLHACRLSSGKRFITLSETCEGAAGATRIATLGHVAPPGSGLCGTLPLHRLYRARDGDHFYTLSAAERDAAVGIGYRYEGIAADVFPL